MENIVNSAMFMTINDKSIAEVAQYPAAQRVRTAEIQNMQKSVIPITPPSSSTAVTQTLFSIGADNMPPKPLLFSYCICSDTWKPFPITGFFRQLYIA